MPPYLDYKDILNEQTFNNSVDERLNSIEHNAALAVTSTVRPSSREKLFQQLGLEFL